MEGNSPEELRALSSKLLHSLQLFFRVERRLTRARMGFDEPLEWDVHTALIESFAMHTRGLSDFFFMETTRSSTDGAAFQYFRSSEDWQQRVGLPGPWLRRVRSRSNRATGQNHADLFGQQVAHLTHHAEPVSDMAAGWPTMQLAAEIGSAAFVFTSAVSKRRVERGFKEAALQELPARAKLPPGLLPLFLWTPPTLRGRR